MDDLEYLRSRIPAYADYEDEDARHLVDKQVRAYVGEALSGLRERLTTIPEAVSERLEQTLLLCEFTDQQVMTVLNHLHVSTAESDLLHEVDHMLVQTADAALSIDLSGVEAYVSQIETLFMRRAQAVFNPV